MATEESAKRSRRVASDPTSWACASIVALVALVLGIRDIREVLFDDAAITFRYAWRIANGHGFTYNDGDRTNGASAPLYTLLLAGMHRAGIGLEAAASAFGAACYAAACGLVTWLGHRFGGLAGAAIAASLLVTSTDFRLLSLSGMESSFAAVLGLTALALVVTERPVLAGVVLGLAVVNKLDAGLLAIAVVVGFATVQRTFPFRLAVAALATASPWLLFATWYFGSPIPYSATQKLTIVKNPTYDGNPLWILRALGADRALVPLGLALLSLFVLPLVRRRSAMLGVVHVSVVGWAAMHLAFFSLANFGDPYSWYVTILYPLVSLGAAILLVSTSELSSSLGLHQRQRQRIAGATWLLGVALVAVPKVPQVWRAADVALRGHEVTSYEHLEATRRAAGQYIGRNAAPGDVVATCFGWIAYGAPENPIAEICPLATRDPVGPPTWGVELEWPDSKPLVLPTGADIVATFTSVGEPGGRTIVFRYGDP